MTDPMHILPWELLDLILSQISRKTLLTCSLVCWAWVPPTRQKVFANRVIRVVPCNCNYRDHTKTRSGASHHPTHVLASPFSTFPDYITRISLYMDTPTDLECPTWEQVCMALAEPRYALKEVQLRRAPVTWSDALIDEKVGVPESVQMLLRSSVFTLESFSLHWRSAYSALAEIPLGIVSSAPKLTSLVLDVRCLKSLARVSPPPQIKEMEIKHLEENCLPFLLKCINTLHSLEIHASGQEEIVDLTQHLDQPGLSDRRITQIRLFQHHSWYDEKGCLYDIQSLIRKHGSRIRGLALALVAREFENSAKDLDLCNLPHVSSLDLQIKSEFCRLINLDLLLKSLVTLPVSLRSRPPRICLTVKMGYAMDNDQSQTAVDQTINDFLCDHPEFEDMEVDIQVEVSDLLHPRAWHGIRPTNFPLCVSRTKNGPFRFGISVPQPENFPWDC